MILLFRLVVMGYFAVVKLMPAHQEVLDLSITQR